MDKKRIGYYDYTVILTYLGLLFACCGIFQVMSKQYWLAVFCLMAAGVCDMFDGTVAKTKERDDGEKCFGIQIDSLSDLVSFGALPALFVYNISGGHPAVGIISALYILAALIRLAYFNVLEQQRQRETPDRKSSFLGVPVTTIAVLLPLVYVIYDYHLLHSRVIFSLMLIVTGAGFLTPATIKKPDALGKLTLIVVGVAEAAVMFLFMGWDAV